MPFNVSISSIGLLPEKGRIRGSAPKNNERRKPSFRLFNPSERDLVISWLAIDDPWSIFQF